MKKWIALILTMSAAVAAADNSRENFEIVFDRNKGGIYQEYKNSLQQYPNLKGKVVFAIDIAKSGEVTGCRVRSTELRNPDLERRLCARIALMKFEPRSEASTLDKPIAFFP